MEQNFFALQTMAVSYYNVLNVPIDADNKAICEAYKKMALKWHPDKNPDNVDEANQRFKQISQAYQVLSDSNKRLKYDRGQSADGADYHHHDFFDFDDDDDDFVPFFNFISPEMVFRLFFERFEDRMFHAHRSFDGQRNGKRNRNRKSQDDRRKGKKCDSHGEVEDEVCHIRTVNGKQWTTKTYYENGKKIVSRYEEEELISKQIDGVFQNIQK